METIKDYLKQLFQFIKETWIYIIALILYVILSSLLPSGCLVKLITGFPCLSCGISRAFISLFQFDFISSFYYYPLWPLVVVILWIVIFRRRPIISKIFKCKYFWISVILIVVITYILRMIYVYPNAPMDYNPYNLFQKLRNLFNK